MKNKIPIAKSRLRRSPDFTLNNTSFVSQKEKIRDQGFRSVMSSVLYKKSID